MSDIYADVSDHSDTENPEEDSIYDVQEIDETTFPDIIPKSNSLRERLALGITPSTTQDDDNGDEDDDDDDDERGDYVEINEDELPDLKKMLKANQEEVQLPQPVKKLKSSFSFRELFDNLKSKVKKKQNNQPEVVIGSPSLVANHPRSVLHSKLPGRGGRGGRGSDLAVQVGADSGRDVRPKQELPDQPEPTEDVIYEDADEDQDIDTGNKDDTEASDDDYEEPVYNKEPTRASPETHQRTTQQSEQRETNEDEYIYGQQNDDESDENQSRISDLYDDARSWVNPSAQKISPRLPDNEADSENDNELKGAPKLHPKPADIHAKQEDSAKVTTDDGNHPPTKRSPRCIDIAAGSGNEYNDQVRAPKLLPKPADINPEQGNNAKVTKNDGNHPPTKRSPRFIDITAGSDNEDNDPVRAPKIHSKPVDINPERGDNAMVTTEKRNHPPPKISPRPTDIGADSVIIDNKPKRSPKVYRKPVDICVKQDKNTPELNAVQNASPVKRKGLGNENTVSLSNTKKKAVVEQGFTETESVQIKSDIKRDDGREVEKLTIAEVCEVLRTLRMGKYVAVFEEEQLSGAILADLTKDDFVNDLGMRGLDAVKLMAFIQNGHIPK